MKPFIFKEFNVSGTEFSMVQLRFTVDEGLTQHIEGRKVWVSPGKFAPQAGCDFIASGCSMSSNNFYEVSGCPTVISMDLRFANVSATTYLLDENLPELLPKLITEFMAQVINGLGQLADHLAVALPLAIKHFDQNQPALLDQLYPSTKRGGDDE